MLLLIHLNYVKSIWTSDNPNTLFILNLIEDEKLRILYLFVLCRDFSIIFRDVQHKRSIPFKMKAHSTM